MYYESKELDKFVSAQARDYATALDEIRRGRKRSHWMWYIFPQLQGLGFSSTAQYYGIRDLEQAKDYMEHPVLAAICLHHRTTAFVCALLLVALLVAGLLAIKARLERPLPPVTILTSKPDSVPDLPPPDDAPELPLADPAAASPSDLPGPDLDAPAPDELDASAPDALDASAPDALDASAPDELDASAPDELDASSEPL